MSTNSDNYYLQIQEDIDNILIDCLNAPEFDINGLIDRSDFLETNPRLIFEAEQARILEIQKNEKYKISKIQNIIYQLTERAAGIEKKKKEWDDEIQRLLTITELKKKEDARLWQIELEKRKRQSETSGFFDVIGSIILLILFLGAMVFISIISKK